MRKLILLVPLLALALLAACGTPGGYYGGTIAPPSGDVSETTPSPAASPAPSADSRPFAVTAQLSQVFMTGEPFKWRHFGADPAYKDRKAAMADRENVFRKFGHSPAEVSCLVEATAHPGKRVRINNGDRFNDMESGGGEVHTNVLVDFTKPVEKMEYSAPAEEWTPQCGGKTIAVILPDVCNNWADQIFTDHCHTISFRADVGGHVSWGAAGMQPFLPDACNAQRQGDEVFTAWSGQCGGCEPAIGYIQQKMGAEVTIQQRYHYKVRKSKQTISFSDQVVDKAVYICLTTSTGRVSCGWYVWPNDWIGTTHIDISDNSWNFDGDCSKK